MGEKSRPPVIGKLMEALFYSGSDGFSSSDSATSPRSPLDLMILSPRGLMKCDFSGIGLGIVAAMDNNGGRHFTVPKTGNEDEDEDEDYTCVISHGGGPNKTFSKRVYFHDDIRKRGQNIKNKNKKKSVPSCMFYISEDGISDDLPAPASDSFLIFCDLCRKRLQGKDIYMYRGERGFCSEECRDAQIATMLQVKAVGTNSIWSAAVDDDDDNNHIESRSDRICCTRDRVVAA